MNKPTNINHAPKDATHWAPERDGYSEGYYRRATETYFWHFVNAYWASDVDERPFGLPAKGWMYNSQTLVRPESDLIPLSELRQLDNDKADAERYRFLKTFSDFDRALESYCGFEMLDPNPEIQEDYIDATIDKAIGERK